MKEIIFNISLAIVFLTCVFCLGVGLKQYIHQDLFGVVFIIACITMAVTYKKK